MITTTPEEVEAEDEVDETETPEQAEEPAVEEEVEVEDEDEMKKLMARVEKCEKMLEEMGKEKAAMEQKLSKISNEPSSASISVEPAEFKSVENKKDSIGSFDITELRAKIRSNR
jgi:hypothetical protein